MTTRVLVAVIALGLWACGGEADDRPGEIDVGASQSPLTSASLLDPPQSLEEFFAGLPEVRGAFHGSWALGEFSGDREFLAQAHEFGDSLIVRLVACLDRRDLSQVEWRGTRISIGALCYAILRNAAYYEWYDDPFWVEAHGEDSGWPGAVDLDASPAQLERAQEAWSDVIKRAVYRRA